MGKYVSIHTAISYLPVELITKEIAQAAIEEGHVSVLQNLPAKYLITEDIIKVIENSSSGMFDLSTISPEALTEKVCEVGVKRSAENIKYVPENKINIHMLNQLLILTYKNIELLSFIPTNVWNTFSAYKGLFSIFGTTTSTSYGRSNKSYSSPLADHKKYELARQLLALVPQEIKTKDFYFGLFYVERLSAKDVTLLVPDELKDYDYWKLLAKYGFDLIPEDKYSYEIFLIAMSKEARGNNKLFNEENLEKLYSCIDDRMASAIVEKYPYYFKKLPMAYRTVPRLLETIESIENKSRYDYIVDDKDVHLLTDKVCRAFVKKGLDLPKIPASVWNSDFAGFCMQNDSSFKWFKQIPKELQTKEIIEKAIEYSDFNIEIARPELISPETSQRVFRYSLNHNDDLQKYIPQAYIDDFINLTGLPVNFFGGEVSLSHLKTHKGNYTYCRLGLCYLGFYKRYNTSNSPAYLIMSRRNPHSIRPQIVFDKEIGTYHNTWLEKMIAENDSLYSKSNVNKQLKELLINSYYGLEYIGFYKGFKLYSNTLYQERINYVAKIKHAVFQSDTKEELQKTIDEHIFL